MARGRFSGEARRRDQLETTIQVEAQLVEGQLQKDGDGNRETTIDPAPACPAS